MRVLILTPEFNGSGGGIGTYYRTLAREFCELGINVRVLEGSGVHAEVDRAARMRSGMLVETLAHSRLVSWEKHFFAFEATPRLRHHLAAACAMWEQADYGSSADIIEAADWGLLFVPPAVETARPLVVQCHGSIGQIADHDPLAGEETDDLIVRLIEKSVLSTAGAICIGSGLNH